MSWKRRILAISQLACWVSPESDPDRAICRSLQSICSISSDLDGRGCGVEERWRATHEVLSLVSDTIPCF